MKRIFSIIATAVVALSCLTSCYEEKMDTFVEWGFADDEKSEISNGLETLLPSAMVIFDAFDTAFFGEYVDLGLPHEAVMKLQSGKATATKNARRTAEKALSMIESGHTCPADYLFVVRIKYDSDKYETVWSHDFR